MSLSGGRVALLLGATGETGSEVLRCLLDSEKVAKIVLVGRREAKVEDSKKVRWRWCGQGWYSWIYIYTLHVAAIVGICNAVGNSRTYVFELVSMGEHACMACFKE